MKFGFVTCVQLGFSCIESIYKAGGKLDLLITLHDQKSRKKSGRIYLDEFSQQHNVPLLKINHINDQEVIDAIREYDLDWLFIIGWSQIAAKAVLEAPKKGCIGIHPTLLPEGRGRAAIPWAIIKGLKKTGVTMFRLDEGVDTGEIIGQEVLELAEDETASTLYKRVNEAHETLIRHIYPKLLSDSIDLLVQDETRATYWEGRTPADGELKSTMKLIEVDRLVRATTRPYPGAFFIEGDKKIIVWKGNPLNEGAGEDSSSELKLKFADGVFLVKNFTIEEI